MRSSAFLEAQKQCMSGSLALRKQIRANLRRMQRELQIAGREDIDALVAAVQRSQRRVLDQLEETSERLQDPGSQAGLPERADRTVYGHGRWAAGRPDSDRGTGDRGRGSRFGHALTVMAMSGRRRGGTREKIEP